MSPIPDVRVRVSIASVASKSVSALSLGGGDVPSPSTFMQPTATTPDPGGQPEFLMLACDGLWARVSEVSAISFIRQRMYAGVSWRDGREQRWTLTSVCRALVEDAIFEKGCQDNVSVIVLWFSPPATSKSITSSVDMVSGTSMAETLSNAPSTEK